MSDERERVLERAAIGGDHEAQTELRELWRRTGRNLLPAVRRSRGVPVFAALADMFRLLDAQILSMGSVRQWLMSGYMACLPASGGVRLIDPDTIADPE